MTTTVELHDRVAALLVYPGERNPDDVVRDARIVGEALPGVGTSLGRFVDRVRNSEPHALEELYTRTFDHNPERALEVGWHAFGETYARGAFLVGMRERLRAVGVPENGELPDHLSHVLQVLGRLPTATASALADGVLANAVRKILEGFKDQDDLYRAPLEAALAVIESHLPKATTPGKAGHA